MVDVADTAFSIAAIRAEEASRPPADRLFDDPFAGLFARAGEHAAEATARYLALPHFRDGVRLRTRFIDDGLRAALLSGLRQVVILGAGFDMRALRLPEVAATGARVFEVDSAPQLARKRRVLDGAGIALPASVAYVPVDFEAGDLEERLAAAGFASGKGAAFVWEGVIGYIDEAAIDDSLRTMARAGGPRTHVIYTSGMDATPSERVLAAGYASVEEVGLDVIWRRHLPGDPPEALAWSRVGVARI